MREGLRSCSVAAKLENDKVKKENCVNLSNENNPKKETAHRTKIEGEDVDVDGNENADTVRTKMGRGRRGRKRGGLKSSHIEKDKVGETGKQEEVPILTAPEESAEKPRERKTEGQRNGSEETNANAEYETRTGKPESGRGRRGRKRKLVDGSMTNRGDAAQEKKVKEKSLDGKIEVVGRILRSRTLVMSGDDKAAGSGLTGGVIGSERKKEIDASNNKIIELNKDESAPSLVGQKKKVKGRRGRPPKVLGKGGLFKVFGLDRPKEKVKGRRGRPPKVLGKGGRFKVFGLDMPKEKVKGRRGRPPKVLGKGGRFTVSGYEKWKKMTRKIGVQPKSKEVIRGSTSIDNGKHSKIASYSRRSKYEGGSEHVECGVDVDVNADDNADRPKLGRGLRGSKISCVESSHTEKDKVDSAIKGDETPRTGDKEKQEEVPILTVPESVEESLVSLGERKMEGQRRGSECEEETNAKANGETHTGKSETGRGRRGRKRKLVDGSVSKGDAAAQKQKKMVKEAPLDGKMEVVGRILRSRIMVTSVNDQAVGVGLTGGVVVSKMKKEFDALNKKFIELDKDRSAPSLGRQKKKVKGRRGRPPKMLGKGPPKMLGKGGLFKVSGYEKWNEMGSRKIGDQPKSKKFIRGSNFADHRKHSRIASCSRHSGDKNIIKQLKRNNHETEGELGMYGPTERQLLTERIKTMLKRAGWTIEYRPRASRAYNDAVYVSPQGNTHWSVTFAYRTLKQQVEDGDADSRASSAFSPLTEEEFCKLVRGRNKGADKINEGVSKKKSSRQKHKRKLGSAIILGAKSLKSSHREQDDLTTSLRRGTQKSNWERRHKKRFSLLVRDSKKSLDPDSEDFVLYGGKRSILSWLIDSRTVPVSGKVQYMSRRRTRVLLEGRITRDGIHCDCCNETLSVSDFESHAGTGSNLCQPFQNLYLESGRSLLQCLRDSWSKYEGTEFLGFHSVDVDGDDPNDDTCNMCGDGGDLICCDGCPSTFHQSCLNIQKFPSGDWHCVYCSCKFCGMVCGNSCQRDQNGEIPGSALLVCRFCEQKYHQLCVPGTDAVHVDSVCKSFCGKKCQEVFERLQVLLGVKNHLGEGFSWTLIQRSDVSQYKSRSNFSQKVECNSKLAVAFSIMDECFLPIVDKRSGINMIRNVVYSCGSNFSRLNYSGFFTAILEKGDEIISAASIRIHGNHLAEMPFIGTRHIYRRQGMCRRLLNAIELALCSINIEKLVIPAIPELLQTWTSVFGFKPLEESSKREMRHINMIVFPGVDMLQKHLLNYQLTEGNLISTPVTRSTKHTTTTHEGANDSDMSPVRSDSKVSHDVIMDHTHETIDLVAADESVLLLPDVSLNGTSDITSETMNFQESVSIENCLIHSGVAPYNQELENKNVMDSEVSDRGASEFCGRLTMGEINKEENAYSGSTHVPSNENSELNQQCTYGVQSKSSYGSQISSKATNCEGKTLHVSNNKVNEGVNGEVHAVNRVCYTLEEDSLHQSSEIILQPQEANHISGSKASLKSVLVKIPGSHEPEVVDSVHNDCFPLGGTSHDPTNPNSHTSDMSNGLCKSSVFQSGVDDYDFVGKTSALNLPDGMDQISCVVPGNDVHHLKDEFIADQTDSHSFHGDSHLKRCHMSINCSKEFESVSQVHQTSVAVCEVEPLCNSSSSPGPTLRTSNRCNASGITQVESRRLLRSGKLC